MITICANPPFKGEFFTPLIAFKSLDETPIERVNLSEKWEEEVSMSSVSIQTMFGAPINVEEVQTLQLGKCYIVDDQPPYLAFSVSLGDEGSASATSELSIYIHPRSER